MGLSARYMVTEGRVDGHDSVAPESESELATVLDGISILAAWRTRGSFSATVFAGSRMESDEYVLEARPMAQAYLLRSTASGAIDSYEWPATSYVSVGEAQPLTSNAIVFEPLAVQLAFPLSLGIWGRAFDSWRIVSGRREPQEIILGLRHRKDVHLDGTLTIDVALRLAVRLDTPVEYCRYQDIKPLHEAL